MTHILKAFGIHHSISFEKFIAPAISAMVGMPQLESRGYRPLQMSFEDHLKILIFFHLEEHTSARHLMQVLQEDELARNEIAPEEGIKKSSFSEATNTRGLEQFLHVFQTLQNQAKGILPDRHPELGNLVGIDGSLIDATLSMYWADYRKNSKKAKVHVGFDLNRGIPRKIFLTEGNGGERSFVSKILSRVKPACWIEVTSATSDSTNGKRTGNPSYAESKPVRKKPSSKSTPSPMDPSFSMTPLFFSELPKPV